MPISMIDDWLTAGGYASSVAPARCRGQSHSRFLCLLRRMTDLRGLHCDPADLSVLICNGDVVWRTVQSLIRVSTQMLPYPHHLERFGVRWRVAEQVLGCDDDEALLRPGHRNVGTPQVDHELLKARQGGSRS